MEYILATKRFAGPNKIQIILKQIPLAGYHNTIFLKNFVFTISSFPLHNV